MKNYEEWIYGERPLFDFNQEIPSFYFKGENSFSDHRCFIDNELSEQQATKRIESIKVLGRSGRLHRTFGDYDSFNYPIEMQLVDFKEIDSVKRWLMGTDKIVLSTDPDKYRIATVMSDSKPIPYANEMNTFWKFTVTFELDPFRRTLRNEIVRISEGTFKIHNPGMVPAMPYFELNSKGGDVKITVNGREFVLKDTKKGLVTVDCERQVVKQGTSFIKNIGDIPLAENEDPYTGSSGINIWKFEGIEPSIMDKRSLWL